MGKPKFLKAIGILALFLFCLSSYAIVEKMSLEKMTQTASRIVLGTVAHQHSQWEPSGTGKRIFTNVYVDVERYVKGSGDSLIEIKVPGGTVDEITQIVSDVPRFTTGERTILFLKDEFFQVVGWAQGKYTVKDDIVLGLKIPVGQFIRLIQKMDEEARFGPIDALETRKAMAGTRSASRETPNTGIPCELTLNLQPSPSSRERDDKKVTSPGTEMSNEGLDKSAAWTAIMTEDFEGAFPSGSWSVTGNPTWDDDDYRPRTGGWSAWCANGGSAGLDPATSNYVNNMNSWMIYGPFDLSDAQDGELLFYYWNESELNYDWFYWLASANGTNFSGYMTSGNSGGWQYQNFDLTNVPSLGDLRGDSSVWIAFVFMSDSSVSSYAGAFVDDIVLQKDSYPNLTPYQPSGWADKIVVSNHSGDHNDDSPLYTSDTLYIDFAVANDGGVATADTFYVRLYVDDIPEATWYVPPPLESGYYVYAEDYPLGPLSAGSHTIKIAADYDDRITESDETDNEYQRIINIISSGTSPTIDLIVPLKASAGTETQVMIIGSNFGTTQGTSTVEFFYRSGQPKIEAPVISWSDNVIICVVPVGVVNSYSASAGSGPVTVTTGSGPSNEYTFKVTFGYGKRKWQVTSPMIPYEVNENTADCTGEEAAIMAGAGIWNSAGACFRFMYDGTTSATAYSYNGHNEIFWGSTGGSIASCITWYTGSTILECDVVFEDALTWGTSGAPGVYDVQNIVTHELGHWLNLKDLYGDIGDAEYDVAKTMYGYSFAGDLAKRTLHVDDVAGIQWIYGGDLWISRHVVADVDGDGQDEAVVDFGASGIYLYDSGAWTQLSDANPESLLAADVDGDSVAEVFADLGAGGLWLWDAGSWSQVNAVPFEGMAAGDVDADGADELVIDFGVIGMWLYDGGAWSQLSGVDADYIACANLDGSGGEEIVADFGATGLWIWDTGAWTQFSGVNADYATFGNTNGLAGEELIGDFGATGLWLWSEGSGWLQLSGVNADYIITGDVDNNGDDELFGDFAAVGLWRWDSGLWTQLSGVDADFMIRADIDGNGDVEVIGDFGTIGLWLVNGGTWTQLSGVNAEYMMAGDVDGDNADEILADFGTLGLWLWNAGTWTQISTSNPD